MAQLKEGRCFNCGSILFLDPSQDKGHCIYCDAVFPTQQAFDIHDNPEGHEFKNEPQPEYTGPNLDPYSNPAHITFDQAPKAPAKAAAKDNYKVKVKEIPEVKADPKLMKIIIAAVVLLVVVFVAITVPLTMKRDQDRERMAREFSVSVNEVADHEESAVLGEDFIIERTDNSRGILIVKELADQAEAEAYFNAFVNARGADRGGNVTLDVLSKDVSYRISQKTRGGATDIQELNQ